MKDTLYFSSLYDLYGDLLTEKQKNYFEDYYFNNLTLSEMSENYEISRNGIHKQLKETCEKLEHYDSILSLLKKKKELEEISNSIEKEDLKKRIKDIL